MSRLIRPGAVLWLLIACVGIQAEEPISIESFWLFQAGDNLEWAQPEYIDQDWQKAWLPKVWPEAGYPQHDQMGWYRKTMQVNHLPRNEVGIRIGLIRNVYEIYAGGEQIGAVGSLPPDVAINYDFQTVYRIPESAINEDGSVLIALRIWGGTQLAVDSSGAGPYGGLWQVGEYTQLVRALDAEDLPKLIFVSLFLLVGFYFLYLRFKTGTFGSFYWFGITSLILAVYILTQTQWKYNFELSFVAYEKVESISLFVFLAALTELIWSVMARPVPVFIRLYQATFLLFAVVFAFAPGLDVHYELRFYWQIALLFGVIPAFWAMGGEIIRGNPDAKSMMFGLVMVTVFGINDLLINMNLHPWSSMRLIPLGFLAVLIAMGLSLANRFTSALSTLEQEVAARTAELSKVNQKLASANHSLMELTRIDPLTGLLNRRGLETEAETERQRFIRQKEPLALVIADIDHFKQFNDVHGHACGDLVLTSVAEIFKEFIRDIDRVARWGGEEFVLLFPGTDEAGLTNITEKLRQKIERFELSYEDKTLSVTMTFGGAIYKESETIDQCLERADEALYLGKSQGRNRVIVAS